MGAKEYARFLAVCTACVGGAAFVSMLFLYYGQRDEKILYEPICGFQGLVASLLVAVRQLMPDAPVVNNSTKCTPADARAGATPMTLTSKVLQMTPKAIPSAPSTNCAAKPTAM